MFKEKILQKNNLKIFLPEELYSFPGPEIYIGVSLEKKRLIVFKRDKGENININNLICPSTVTNNCLTIPLGICEYLEWDFSDSLELYRISDCIIIEPL